jgi:predicted tellurium resistance membrane protein TerC
MRALAAFLFLAVAAAPASATEQPNFRVERADKSRVEGPWSADTITIDTEGGQFVVQARKIKSITFGDPGNDAIEVDGFHHRLRGTARLDAVVVNGVRVDRHDAYRIKRLRVGPPNVFRDILIPLLTLVAMEIVLGIDNVIFLAVVAGKLPKEQQPKARRLGLLGALITRIMLLVTLSFILGLTSPVLTLPSLPFLSDREAREISWRDIILLAGGLFLIAKSTIEIHAKLHHHDEDRAASRRPARFGWVLVEIAVIDIVFSLDSVITAVGMVESVWVMVVAVMIAMIVMLAFAGPISQFVMKYPTLKVLALAFLILIGVLLVVEGLGQHMDKGYVYFAMAFSVLVEVVNLRLRTSAKPLPLNQPSVEPAELV